MNGIFRDDPSMGSSGIDCTAGASQEGFSEASRGPPDRSKASAHAAQEKASE